VAFADGGGAVAAAVEQHMHLLLAVAHHDHRLAADVAGLVAAGLGDLAGVGNPHPGVGEDLVHLGLEDGRVGVEEVCTRSCWTRSARVWPLLVVWLVMVLSSLFLDLMTGRG
jgi:hypothetical protein